MIKLNQKLFSIFICIVSSNCTADNASKTQCDKWIVNAVKTVESVPPKDRFKRSLDQLQSACEQLIPDKLKQAAKNSLQTTSVSQRQTILQQATAPYFSKSCLDIGAGQSAKQLMHICLGEDFLNGPYTSILPNIDAASYLYGKVIEKEFKNARLDPFYAKKFLLNYFLGAALEFEDQKQ